MKYFLAIIAIIFLSGFLLWFTIYVPKEPWFEESEIFLVKKGEGARTISQNLKEQGLIRSNFLFKAYVLVKKQGAKLQAGEYELSSSMNIPEIAARLASEDRIKKMLTIIEGWTVKDIEQYLKKQSIVIEESLAPELEGYLFPDTYEILPGEGIEEIIKKMRDNFEKKVGAKLPSGSLAPRTASLDSLIIMASLLEKEVQTFEDKKIVSGILWKRLENNMLLQVDATIVYITGRKSIKITKEELEIDSPYNTYKYKGLPPGPICNPGLESIEAAIFPELSSYWFYLSTSEGETIFSKTLQEHNLAKAKYLL